ncbi:MAG: co-chaperone GroES [Dehalococcoidia bacterium]|nr:co-chaperone GroES [Dehalococcoidia bacterium]
MPNKLEPIGDRVVIEPIKLEAKTKSGLIMPDTAQEKSQEGKVIAVGPGRHNDEGLLIKMDVSVGDKVMYAKYAGVEFKEDGKDYLILENSSILAKILITSK